MQTSYFWAFTLPCLAALPACSSSDNGNASTQGSSTAETCDVVVKDADCDTSQRPFIFVHGTYGSGDNFAHVAALLASNGFCADRIIAVEYNSLGDKPGNTCTGSPPPQGCGNIDKVIDKALADFGVDQVDIAGHSQGTAHCGAYLNGAGEADPANAGQSILHADVATAHRAKVAHYINFSGRPDVGDVQTLSLSSHHDLPGPPPPPHHATGSNVKAVTLDDEDHFAVAASTRSFVELYKYLKDGEEPKYTEVQCGEDPVTIEGLAETFADNQPVAGKLEIRPVGDTPRGAGDPEITLTGDSTGHIGPIQLKRNVPYEFKGYGADGVLIGYQYFTPFKRSNRLVRLLSPASANDGSSVGGTIATLSTDHVVRGADHVALVARWAGGAFRQDLGASMVIDGQEILTSDNAGEASFSASGLSGGCVGFFMNDHDQNKQSDFKLYYSGPFIAFTDVYIGTDQPKFADIAFTPGSEDANVKKQKVKISNWPSDAAQILVMFQ